MRLSPQFFKNGISAEAKRLAQQLASLCHTICSFAADIWKGTAMDAMQFDDQQNDLVRHTIDACQNAIAGAVKNPSQAIGLARGLEGALTSLLLVQREVAKGEAGAVAVTANADELTRQALTDVLKFSAQPKEALAALAAVEECQPACSVSPQHSGADCRARSGNT